MTRAPRARVRLIHWNAGEAREAAARMRAAGYRVEYDPLTPAVLRSVRQRPPAAVVIDLSRLPSHGRDVGVALRQAKATRAIPLVFVDGAPEKVSRARAVLPDAVFTSWGRVRSALRRAISRPPRDPAVPASALAGYSGTPLPVKLGIKPGATVVLIRAPRGFERQLQPLPAGVRIERSSRGRRDVTLWFVASGRRLRSGLPGVTRLAANAVWIIWPKHASGRPTDLTQQRVREAGLGAGLVDYKIAAIDATWSGLKFTQRKRTRR